MSAVTLLSSGAQAASGTGSAVDVSAGGVLRLDIQISANLGTSPDVQVTFETAPTASGPWTELRTERFFGGNTGLAGSSAIEWPATGKRRVRIAAFDAFMRVRWSGRCTQNTKDGTSELALMLGVAGTNEAP